MSRGRVRARRGATKTMAFVLLCVVGLAGVGVGFAAERFAVHGRRSARFAGDRSRFSIPEMPSRGSRELRPREEMRERFARELELTAPQQARVDSIMTQQMRDFRRLREEVQPRFDSLIDRAQRELEAVLTPAQRERLKTLRDREAFGPRDAFGPRSGRPSAPTFP